MKGFREGNDRRVTAQNVSGIGGGAGDNWPPWKQSTFVDYYGN